MTNTNNNALAHYLNNIVREMNLEELPTFLYDFFHDFILPLAILLICFAGFLKLLLRLYRLIIPPPPKQRHAEIKLLYRKGYTKQALKEWERDLPTYPPSILSRACHEIYIRPTQNPKAGIDLLSTFLKNTDDVKTREKKEYIRQAQNMKSDAIAIQHGNERMVDMNARLAKQEYLGITTL